MTNWISPTEAIMTPMTMKDTFPRVFMFGGARPMTHEVIRTATGVVACEPNQLLHFSVARNQLFQRTLIIWMKETERYR